MITASLTDNELRQSLVNILKALQVDSMAVNLEETHKENVDYLTDKLHWAEAQIEVMYNTQIRQALDSIEVPEKVATAYNHKMKNLNLPEGMQDYITSYENNIGYNMALAEVTQAIEAVKGKYDA